MEPVRFSVEKSTLLKIQQSLRIVKRDFLDAFWIALAPLSEVRMRTPFSLLAAGLFLACSPRAAPETAPQVVLTTTISGQSQWEPDIRRFEAADRTSPPGAGAAVFVGSSSIRMWETLEADFPGRRVLNRGFGGSELGDVVQFADRIVLPYKPRVVILYAGDNDLAAGKTPAQVLRDFQSFVAIVHRKLPQTRIAFVAIKPSVARLNIMDEAREANQLIRDSMRGDDKLTYVDVFTPMLDASGQPRRELFLEDGLHMNATGYAIWRDLIAPLLK
jgi:lysophospholipase L1-like esterase